MSARENELARILESYKLPTLFSYRRACEAGIREVVDWIMSQVDFEDDEVCPYYVLNKNVWQAKLKEWGID